MEDLRGRDTRSRLAFGGGWLSLGSIEVSLFYRGPLKANGNLRAKQALRLHFAPQLERALESTPQHRADPGRTHRRFATDRPVTDGRWKFLPVASRDPGSVRFSRPLVSLNILLLRPGALGNILSGGGDIDNRLKTLFDAMQTPTRRQAAELDDPGQGPTDLYCLMSDDKQIRSVSVRTQQLLDVPQDSKEVVLVIEATITGGTLLDHEEGGAGAAGGVNRRAPRSRVDRVRASRRRARS